MVRELTDGLQTRERHITCYCWFTSTGVGFASRGSVGCSFTLIGSEYSTRAVLNQSQVTIIGKPSSQSG